MNYIVCKVCGAETSSDYELCTSCYKPLESERSLAYESLYAELMGAYDQASKGKGKERHALKDEPFEKQKICEITRRVGLGYPLGQAIKKCEESLRLGDRGPAELYGAINYIAAALIVMKENLRED